MSESNSGGGSCGCISFVVGVALLIALVYGLHEWCSGGIDRRVRSMEAGLDVTIVLDGDTAKTIDYSFFDETYTLTNGKTVSKVIVDKQAHNRW